MGRKGGTFMVGPGRHLASLRHCNLYILLSSALQCLFIVEDLSFEDPSKSVY